MNGVDALMKETPEIPCAFCCERTRGKTAVYEPGSKLSPDLGCASILIWDILASRTVRNNFVLFIYHLLCGILF